MKFNEGEPIANLEKVSNVKVSFSEKFYLSDIVDAKTTFFVGATLALLREIQTANVNPVFLTGIAASIGLGFAFCLKMPNYQTAQEESLQISEL